MLSTVTGQQRRAAQALSQTAYWPMLHSLLNAELAAITQALVETQNLVTVHQLQGRAKATRAILDVVLTASAVLEKIERIPLRSVSTL